MEDFNDFIQGFEVRTIFDGLMIYRWRCNLI
jgi:hypothetical protein